MSGPPDRLTDPAPRAPVSPADAGEHELALDLDEVGVALGFDEVTGGLFDRSAPEISGGDPTNVTGSPAHAPLRRTAVLAWIAADLPEPSRSSQAPRQRPAEEEPPGPALSTDRAAPGAIGALRSLLLEEPLDPVPPLDVPTPLIARHREAPARPGDDEHTAPLPALLPGSWPEPRQTTDPRPDEASGTMPRLAPPAAPHPVAEPPLVPPPPLHGVTALFAGLILLLASIAVWVLR